MSTSQNFRFQFIVPKIEILLVNFVWQVNITKINDPKVGDKLIQYVSKTCNLCYASRWSLEFVDVSYL